MARVRVLKRQNSAYLELPPELLNYDEVELFPLKEGYYLLSVPLGAREVKPQQKGDDAGERGLLKKLLAIRFENRTPAQVNKALDDEEKTILKELERKGLVNVFRGTKYKDGVYNINDRVYAMLSHAEGETLKPGTRAAQPAGGQMDSAGILIRQGYLVISDKNEARALSERLAQEMKNGSVAGVKGFDGKFYIVTRNYLVKAQALIATALKENMDAAGIATATKLEPEGCLAALRVLAESGEIIEKKRGIFAPV